MYCCKKGKHVAKWLNNMTRRIFLHAVSMCVAVMKMQTAGHTTRMARLKNKHKKMIAEEGAGVGAGAGVATATYRARIEEGRRVEAFAR